MKLGFVLLILIIIPGFLGAQHNEEFRATWVITWEHISSSGSVADKQARVRRIMDLHQAANMNAVIWQVRQSGTAYYRSSYEPWGYYAGYQDPGYDHLEYAVEEAHKRGMELHAWFNVFHASSTYPGTPAAEHPEWVCRDPNGNPMTESRALSPGLQAVRDYTINVAMEIVRNYDIDGLHLDYVRWNEYYSPITKEQSLSKIGTHELPGIDGLVSEEHIQNLEINQANRYLYDVEHPYSAGIPDSIPGTPFASWENYWRWSVTEFVRVLHDSIQAIKPWVRLSPAALGKYNWSGWNGYNVVYQDAALWINEGYIDQLMMMSYHWLDGQGFYNMLVGDPDASWAPHIQQGIADGRLISVGPPSYRLSEDNIWSNHVDIVERCREVTWNDGFQFFSYGDWVANKYWEESTLQIFQRLTKVRAAAYLSGEIPPAPSLSGSKLDSLTYELTINPPFALEQNQRFALYRSEDEMLDKEEDQIIDIHFGLQSYIYTDSISGLQDFDGQYRYFVTTLNRYWNESEPSNSYITDPIPSFAPQVISTIPGMNDTVNVNTDLIVLFSKTMDISSFTNNVQFSPSVQISELLWSDDNKKLTIWLEDPLEYDTEYNLTILQSVTDINGKELDGNGDGQGSEDFILQFYADAADTLGPRVTTSYPALDDTSGYFDVDDIISITFDELLDKSSVDENSVFIQQGGNQVTSSVEAYDYRNKSTISLKPMPAFDPARQYSIILDNTISDTLGNASDTTITFVLETEPYIYVENLTIDEFIGTSIWKSPGYSGSTNGVNIDFSTFQIVSGIYLPGATRPLDKKSAELYYVWDPDFLNPVGSEYLLREYCSAMAEDQPNPPVSVHFDTSYTLQCYVFGDGSRNKIRFALDEGNGLTWSSHEVSTWQEIDWIGWKLVEWKLSDPGSVGDWVGNGVMDAPLYRIDSFQLTHEDGAAMSGTIYFKDLRVIKKTFDTVGAIAAEKSIPLDFTLRQNYPNPFNAQTTIEFFLARPGFTELTLYDVLGKRLRTLLKEDLSGGTYRIRFDASDLASGIYIYQLQSGHISERKKMMLIK